MAYANTNNAASATGHGSVLTSFVNADGSAVKSILTVPAGKTYKITGIAAINTDTDTAYDFAFKQNDGTSDFQINKVQIPANSGNTNAITPKDILRGSQFLGLTQDDIAGNKYMILPAGHVLKANCTSTIDTGSGETVIIKVDYAIYE